MEKKKVNKTSKKTTKVVAKKNKTKTTSKSTKKKKGFTLIELLAVIIILGILMIIAIPSVTRYINDSRKSAYIDTAKEIVGGTRNIVNEGNLGMYDTGTTYYIPAKYVNTENALKSPYGEFTETSAYVGVIYDGQGYKYYWISSDDTGQGIPVVTPIDKLDTDDIKSDLNPNDILTTIEKTGIGNREKIKILNTDGTWRPIQLSDTSNNVSEEGGNSSKELDVLVYPTGKTKATVETGDIVKIGTEEFYVVKHDGNDLVLLTHYNLNVGNNAKGTVTGIQDPYVKGWILDGTKYGNVDFSSTSYWNGKVGSDYAGTYCTSNKYTSGTNCAYVYDGNSSIKTYIDSYKTYLEGQGVRILEARLLRLEEAYALGCGNGGWSCKESPANAPSWVYETSYWLGNAGDNSSIWRVYSNGYFDYLAYTVDACGVRPVIVI